MSVNYVLSVLQSKRRKVYVRERWKEEVSNYQPDVSVIVSHVNNDMAEGIRG